MFGIEQEVETKISKIKEEMRSRAERGSQILKNHSNEILGRPGSGRVYKKANKGSFHTASSPGEPPALDTGNLRGSYRPVPNIGSGTATVALRTECEYAGYLEHGTSKMAARPHVEKIKQESLSEIVALYNQPYSV